MADKKRNEIIANNIKKYIKQNKITQRGLAKAIGVSESTMSDYMNLRSNPSHGVIQKIADHFGVAKSDIDTTYKDENGHDSELLSKLYNTITKLNVDNQRDVYDYVEMKLNKQNASKIVNLPKKVNDVEIGEDPTIVRAAHLDMDGITDEEMAEVNEFYKFADEYASNSQKNKE